MAARRCDQRCGMLGINGRLISVVLLGPHEAALLAVDVAEAAERV